MTEGCKTKCTKALLKHHETGCKIQAAQLKKTKTKLKNVKSELRRKRKVSFARLCSVRRDVPKADANPTYLRRKRNARRRTNKEESNLLPNSFLLNPQLLLRRSLPTLQLHQRKEKHLLLVLRRITVESRSKGRRKRWTSRVSNTRAMAIRVPQRRSEREGRRERGNLKLE